MSTLFGNRGKQSAISSYHGSDQTTGSILICYEQDNKNEAKSMAIKALRLPGSVKHMEETPMDKLLALDKQDAEKISLTRYEQSMLRNAGEEDKIHSTNAIKAL